MEPEVCCLRRGLVRDEALIFGLDLWLLEDLRWLLSERSPLEELRPWLRLSRCCLSLRVLDRLASLFRDEEVLLPRLSPGWMAADGESPLRFKTPVSCRFSPGTEEESFSLLLPSLSRSRSLLLFFFVFPPPSASSLTFCGSLGFLRECRCL